MKKIFVLSGIPGSGKSKLAREIWEKSPQDTVVINNDCLRGMITSHSEDEVNDTYHLGLKDIRQYIVIAKESLVHTFIGIKTINTLVVDACHFDRYSIQFFEKLKNKDIEIFYILLDVNIKIALENSQKRKRVEDMKTILFVKNELAKLNHRYSFIIRSDVDKINFFKKFFKKNTKLTDYEKN